MLNIPIHKNHLAAIYLNEFEKALIFDTTVKLLERQNGSIGSKSVSISIFHSARHHMVGVLVLMLRILMLEILMLEIG